MCSGLIDLKEPKIPPIKTSNSELIIIADLDIVQLIIVFVFHASPHKIPKFDAFLASSSLIQQSSILMFLMVAFSIVSNRPVFFLSFDLGHTIHLMV